MVNKNDDGQILSSPEREENYVKDIDTVIVPRKMPSLMDLQAACSLDEDLYDQEEFESGSIETVPRQISSENHASFF